MLFLLLLLFKHNAKSSITQEVRLIDDRALPAARDISEVARAYNRRCKSHTGNDRLIWCLLSSPSLSVGSSIQDEAMDVAHGVV